MPRSLQLALLVIITLAWIANLVISYVNPSLGQQAVNAPFMIVAAILYRALRRGKPDEPEQSAQEVLDEARRVTGEITGSGRPGDAP